MSDRPKANISLSPESRHRHSRHDGWVTLTLTQPDALIHVYDCHCLMSAACQSESVSDPTLMVVMDSSS